MQQLKNIPIDLLVRGKFQAREDFDEQYIAELAASITANGLVQPIVVRSLTTTSYEIIAGECRWRAAQRANLEEIPCLIKNYNDEEALAVTAIENIQRKDLNPIEEAIAYQKFIEEFNYAHEEIAAVVGKSRVAITNSLRLLKLDKWVQNAICKGKLTEGHGKVLLGVAEENQQYIAKQCVKNNWSVRKLEQEIKKGQKNYTAIRHSKDPNVEAIKRLIAEQMGTEVDIETNLNGSGWLKIKYFNPETLAGVLERLGIKLDDK